MALSAGADSEKPPRKSRSGSDGEALERAACRNRSRRRSGLASLRKTGSPSGESRMWSGSAPGSRADFRCDTSTRNPSPADSRGDAPGGWYFPSGVLPLYTVSCWIGSPPLGAVVRVARRIEAQAWVLEQRNRPLPNAAGVSPIAAEGWRPAAGGDRPTVRPARGELHGQGEPAPAALLTSDAR